MVTQKMLDIQLSELNSFSKRRYKLQCEGGRCALATLENRGGGISLVSEFLTRTNISDCLRAINNYNTKEKTEPLEKLK